MLKVEVWPDVHGSLTWPRLLQSRKSMHQPGLVSEIKRAYQYEPIVFSDGTINVPQVFPGGENFVLVEKTNFVAVWGYGRKENRFSQTGYGIISWFRYYYLPEPKFNGEALTQPTARRKATMRLAVQRLAWGQLGSRLQGEITDRWPAVAPSWMQAPDRIGRFRPGLVVSGKTGRTASITAADLVAADPTVIELGEVEMLTGRISDDDILL